MKYLITGHSGFVGKHLIKYILRMEDEAEIIGVDIVSSLQNSSPHKEYEINLLDKASIDTILSDHKPDYIIHLASFSSVAYSWKEPIQSFRNNTNIFLNLLESIYEHSPKSKLLSVGSSEEYGSIDAESPPLKEENKLSPLSPYAVARVAQENLSVVYSKGFNLDIVCTRSFNHIGCGQEDKFVVSSLGKRFAELKSSKTNEVVVGDTRVIRDFLDVRDVVRAYYMLLKNDISSGKVFNVCSGKGISIQGIIELYKQITGTHPKLTVNQDLLRPVENVKVVGSNEKIKELIGWEPSISLIDSLTEISECWNEKV